MSGKGVAALLVLTALVWSACDRMTQPTVCADLVPATQVEQDVCRP